MIVLSLPYTVVLSGATKTIFLIFIKINECLTEKVMLVDLIENIPKILVLRGKSWLSSDGTLLLLLHAPVRTLCHTSLNWFQRCPTSFDHCYQSRTEIALLWEEESHAREECHFSFYPFRRHRKHSVKFLLLCVNCKHFLCTIHFKLLLKSIDPLTYNRAFSKAIQFKFRLLVGRSDMTPIDHIQKAPIRLAQGFGSLLVRICTTNQTKFSVVLSHPFDLKDLESTRSISSKW